MIRKFECTECFGMGEVPDNKDHKGSGAQVCPACKGKKYIEVDEAKEIKPPTENKFIVN